MVSDQNTDKMAKLRRTLRRLGEYLQKVNVSNVLNSVLALIGTGFIAININTQLEWSYIFWIPAAIVLIGLAYVIFLVVSFFLNEVIRAVGKRLIKLSKWYPKFWYNPKYDYYFKATNKKEASLYITASPKNQKIAHLGVQFAGIRVVNNFVSEQQPQIDEVIARALPHVDNRVLYNKQIYSGDTRIVKVAEVMDGNLNLVFINSRVGVSLIPGKYAYQFQEWGTHKGHSHGGKTIEIFITLNDRGEIEV